MNKSRLWIILLFILLPLTSFALPISNLNALNSGTSLLFYNTIYSGRLLDINFNSASTPSSTTTGGTVIKNPNLQTPTNNGYNPPTSQCNVTIDGNQPPTQPTAPVPEPATMLLLGSGIMGLVSMRNRLNMR